MDVSSCSCFALRVRKIDSCISIGLQNSEDSKGLHPYTLFFFLACLENSQIFSRKKYEFMLIEKMKLSGCCVSWKCSGIANVKASRIQVHKWTVHICELFCYFSLPMVNPTPSDLLHHHDHHDQSRSS